MKTLLLIISTLLINATGIQMDETFQSKYQVINGIESYDDYSIRIDAGITIRKDSRIFMNFSIREDKGNDEYDLISSSFGLYKLEVLSETPGTASNGFSYNNIIKITSSGIGITTNDDTTESYTFYIFKKRK